MSQSLFSSMTISSMGMAAQRQRMDVVTQNIANAESTRTEDGKPYRRRQIVFQSGAEPASFASMFSSVSKSSPLGVQVKDVIEDQSPFRKVYDPSHPDADASGVVLYPNVNPVSEMIDLTSAARSFEANATSMEASKRMFLKTLELMK